MKSNKAISFVLLLGLFMFLMEAEGRLSSRIKADAPTYFHIDSIETKTRQMLFQLAGKAPKEENSSEKFLSFQN